MIVVITVAAMLYVLVAVPALTVKAGLVAHLQARGLSQIDGEGAPDLLAGARPGAMDREPEPLI